MPADLLTHLPEQTCLKLQDALFRIEDPGFVLLQFGRDKPLRIDQRLFAVIVLRHSAQVRLGNLDVVAKHLVKADLERFDAGPFAFAALQAGNPLPGISRCFHNAVQLLGVTARDDTWLVEGSRRVLDNGLPDEIANFYAWVQRQLCQRLGQMFDLAQGSDDGRHALQTGPKPRQIARAGHACQYTIGQPFQITQLLEVADDLHPHRRVLSERFYGVQPAVQCLDREERLAEPGMQQPAPHRRDRGIQHVQECPARRAAADGLCQLQVAPGGSIQAHEATQCVGAETGDLGQPADPGLAQVLDDRAGRPHGPRPVRAAVTCQRRHAEVVQQRPSGRFQIEVPPGVRCDEDLAARRDVVWRKRDGRPLVRFRDQALRRPDALQLVPDQRLRPLPIDLGRPKFSGCYVNISDAGMVTIYHQRRQVVVALVFQQTGLYHRTRRHHACHLTGHQPSDRLPHLLTDGYAVAFLDQPSNVALNGVVGHAGHGVALITAGGELPTREHQVQLPRCDPGIFVKGLVEISQPEEQNRVRVLFLDFQILTVEGCWLGHE